jgi:hypothetical protein
MTYERPAIEFRQPIAGPLVLGSTYTFTPTWTDDTQRDPA